MKTLGMILGMIVVVCLISSSTFAGPPNTVRTTQGIYEPEGMNMTGEITTPNWTEPPPEADFAGIQTGGHFLLDNTSFWRRYHTVVNVPSDFAAGTFQWLFTSGPSTNYYANKWAATTVIFDSIQTYATSGANNSVTSTTGYYTVNFRDNGYASTQAIWIQTATLPVPIYSVTNSPLIASASVPETLTVKTSSAISSQENFFVRYSTDNFASSTILSAPITVGDSIGKAIIPGQTGGTTVTYYAFSSKLANPTTDFDMVTLQYNNNGNANYSYSIAAPSYKIVATAGPNGTIIPQDTVSVPPNGSQLFNFTPNAGYYVDNVLVDNISVGNPSSYQFTNVTANHTIAVTFWHNVNITFQVNMKLMFQKGFFQTGDTVSVNGTFNSYTPKVNMLTDVANDSIYTATISIRAEQNISYKFWKSRGPLNWEDDISNRTDSVGDIAAVLPVVFFDNQNPNINVLFQLNMSVQMQAGSFRPDSGDVVQVRGDFNSWGSTDTLTDPNHDSIYTKTLSIPGDATSAYKFWKTFRNGQDYEIVGGSPVTNRGLTLGTQDTTLPVVYYNDDSSLPTTAVSYAAGWNMVSIPRILLDYSKVGIYPHAVSNCFKYSGSYVIVSVLENRKGYWVKFTNDTTITYTGSPRTFDIDSTTIGWNMIGSLSSAVVTTSITSNPSGVIASKYFGYNHGYKIVDTLQPGMGYWVKTDSVATLSLTASGPAAKVSVKNNSFASFDKITVRDAKGNEQVLYLNHDKDQTGNNMYEMPPAPFAEAFDVRFSSNRFVEQVAADKNQDFPISISGAVYPVTVSWDIKSNSAGLSIATGRQENSLRGQGAARISNSNETVHILASSSTEIPKAFALAQNYPNPFNPTTNIHYDVPEQAMVHITVYNLLGERIADLVSGIQDAGYHSLEWNATNDAGQPVASGVYFYSIKATSLSDLNKSFQSVKKMMLLR